MHDAQDGCLDRYDECKAICEAVIAANGRAGGGGASGATGSGGSN